MLSPHQKVHDESNSRMFEYKTSAACIHLVQNDNKQPQLVHNDKKAWASSTWLKFTKEMIQNRLHSMESSFAGQTYVIIHLKIPVQTENYWQRVEEWRMACIRETFFACLDWAATTFSFFVSPKWVYTIAFISCITFDMLGNCQRTVQTKWRQLALADMTWNLATKLPVELGRKKSTHEDYTIILRPNHDRKNIRLCQTVHCDS